jgi:pyruvate formate lyase activating enzyme
LTKKPPARPEDLVIGGYTPLTTIDYPGQLSAVIFLQGCPWRCGYCQNADLIPRKRDDGMQWQDIVSHLQKRRGLLDAVVFSGGEPTMQKALIAAIETVKAMGFKVGLHSAGIYPQRLRKILPALDWIGLDIKAALHDYPTITGVENSGERAWQSAKLVIDSGIDHEFRCTVHPALHDEMKLDRLSRELQAIGAQHFVLQQCINKHCLDERLRNIPATPLDTHFSDHLQSTFTQFSIR